MPDLARCMTWWSRVLLEGNLWTKWMLRYNIDKLNHGWDSSPRPGISRALLSTTELYRGTFQAMCVVRTNTWNSKTIHLKVSPAMTAGIRWQWVFWYLWDGYLLNVYMNINFKLFQTFHHRPCEVQLTVSKIGNAYCEKRHTCEIVLSKHRCTCRDCSVN